VKTVRSVLATFVVVAGCIASAGAQKQDEAKVWYLDRQLSQQRMRAAVPDVVIAAAQSQGPQQEQQQEFTPIEQLPPQEQLPAARLLIAAYCFVLAALFLYVVSVSRRLGSVRREVQRLETDLKRSGRA
jgi:hypothetical protein